MLPLSWPCAPCCRSVIKRMPRVVAASCGSAAIWRGTPPPHLPRRGGRARRPASNRRAVTPAVGTAATRWRGPDGSQLPASRPKSRWGGSPGAASKFKPAPLGLRLRPARGTGVRGSVRPCACRKPAARAMRLASGRSAWAAAIVAPPAGGASPLGVRVVRPPPGPGLRGVRVRPCACRWPAAHAMRLAFGRSAWAAAIGRASRGGRIASRRARGTAPSGARVTGVTGLPAHKGGPPLWSTRPGGHCGS